MCELTENQDNGYLNHKYDIVTKIAYLIGVREDVIKESDGYSNTIYEEMKKEKNARIIRNLSFIRSMLFRNFRNINHDITYQLKNIDAFPEYIPLEILDQLKEDGVEVWHANWRINQYLLFVSNEIKRHISECKKYFPIWLKWEYIKELFVIPGLKEEWQLKDFRTIYLNHLDCYPFQMYVYLEDPRNIGNILHNDEKFIVHMLYPAHGKSFKDISKVRDISEKSQMDIRTFLEEGKKIVVVVDCENADPYKLYAMFEHLSTDEVNKIQKILLYNDVHTTSVWQLLKRFVFVQEIEHQMVERVKGDKSLVDIALTVGVCKEYYENQVDSFLLVSSDSDYWGVIQGMPYCKFFVLAEKNRISSSMTKAMEEKHIPYVYIDDFSSDLEKIQKEAIEIELRSFLKDYCIDMNMLFEQAMDHTRSMQYLSANEIRSLKEYFIKKCR